MMVGVIRRRETACFKMLAMFALILAASCDRSTSHERNDGYAVVKSKDGTTTEVRLGPGPLPPEFPPGLNLYPGAEFTSTARTGNKVLVLLSTPDSADQVFAHYRALSGFEELKEVEVEEYRSLLLMHEETRRDVQVLAKPVGSRTEISLVVFKK